MPAYNAEKTLEKTVQDIPQGFSSEIIVVDDCSQ
ncbi:MAG: glycosyltransferase, partial [Thermodesulfobacteriota bacterium]